MTWASTQYKRPLAHPATAFTVGTPSRQRREAVGATGSGAAVPADPRKESDFRWPLATAFGGRGSLQIRVAMLREAAKREQQLLANQLRCAWEKQQAQEEQRLKEREQWQRATETRQLDRKSVV